MNKFHKIMVCVTEQKTCERLITKGMEYRDSTDGEIFIIHVAIRGNKVIEDEKAVEALEYLFEIAVEYDASLTVLKSNDVLKTLKDFALKNEIDLMIMGETREVKEEDSVIFKLKKEFDRYRKDIKVKVVPLKFHETKAIV